MPPAAAGSARAGNSSYSPRVGSARAAADPLSLQDHPVVIRTPVSAAGLRAVHLRAVPHRDAPDSDRGGAGEDTFAYTVPHARAEGTVADFDDTADTFEVRDVDRQRAFVSQPTPTPRR